MCDWDMNSYKVILHKDLGRMTPGNASFWLVKGSILHLMFIIFKKCIHLLVSKKCVKYVLGKKSDQMWLATHFYGF